MFGSKAKNLIELFGLYKQAILLADQLIIVGKCTDEKMLADYVNKKREIVLKTLEIKRDG